MGYPYSWRSGGEWYTITIPNQDPNEDDGTYINRVGALIHAAQQEHRPD